MAGSQSLLAPRGGNANPIAGGALDRSREKMEDQVGELKPQITAARGAPVEQLGTLLLIDNQKRRDHL